MLTVVAALLGLLFWRIAPYLATFLGAWMICTGFLGLVFTSAVPSALATMCVGIVVWLGGHRAVAYRTGWWRSRIARRIFTRPAAPAGYDSDFDYAIDRPSVQSGSAPRPGADGEDFTLWEDELRRRPNQR